MLLITTYHDVVSFYNNNDNNNNNIYFLYSALHLRLRALYIVKSTRWKNLENSQPY